MQQHILFSYALFVVVYGTFLLSMHNKMQQLNVCCKNPLTGIVKVGTLSFASAVPDSKDKVRCRSCCDDEFDLPRWEVHCGRVSSKKWKTSVYTWVGALPGTEGQPDGYMGVSMEEWIKVSRGDQPAAGGVASGVASGSRDGMVQLASDGRRGGRRGGSRGGSRGGGRGVARYEMNRSGAAADDGEDVEKDEDVAEMLTSFRGPPAVAAPPLPAAAAAPAVESPKNSPDREATEGASGKRRKQGDDSVPLDWWSDEVVLSPAAVDAIRASEVFRVLQGKPDGIYTFDGDNLQRYVEPRGLAPLADRVFPIEERDPCHPVYTSPLGQKLMELNMLSLGAATKLHFGAVLPADVACAVYFGRVSTSKEDHANDVQDVRGSFERGLRFQYEFEHTSLGGSRPGSCDLLIHADPAVCAAANANSPRRWDDCRCSRDLEGCRQCAAHRIQPVASVEAVDAVAKRGEQLVPIILYITSGPAKPHNEVLLDYGANYFERMESNVADYAYVSGMLRELDAEKLARAECELANQTLKEKLARTESELRQAKDRLGEDAYISE